MDESSPARPLRACPDALGALRLLALSSNAATRAFLATAMGARLVDDVEQLRGALAEGPVDAALIDITGAADGGVATLGRVKAAAPSLALVAIAERAGPGSCHLCALRHGADDFITAPLRLDALRFAVRAAMERAQASREVSRLNAALVDAERAAAETRMMRRFVETVGHEFRTPLAVISYNQEKLARICNALPAPPPAQTALKKIRRAVTRQTELIDSLLAASRMDAGRLTIRREPLRLAALLKAMCARKAELCDTHRLSFRDEAADDRIDADPAALTHVFDNLFSNAVKYSPDAPEIAVQLSGEERCLRIDVIDRGIGVPAQDIERIWERFYRAENAVGAPGTGVGLDLVQHFVRAHGGRVAVESEVGRGSRFTVILPRHGEPGAA